MGNPTNARPSTVQQHHAASSDINAIMARHAGNAPGVPVGNPSATRMPRFEALSSQSYHEMLNRVTDIRSKFATLPSRLRRRFNNDPYQMFRFLEAPENRFEAVKLGLVHPTEEEHAQLLLAQESERQETIRKAQEALGQLNAFPRPDPEAQPSYGSQKPSQPAPKPA